MIERVVRGWLGAVLGLSLVVCAVGQQAGTYETKSASSATSAEVMFPASGTLQARLVGLIASSDKAGAVAAVQYRVGAYVVSATNVAGTNLTLLRTNGLALNDVLVIQTRSGTLASATVNWISRTNVGLAAATIATVPGDAAYKLGAATRLAVDAVTNVCYQGESIVAAPQGRPLRIAVDGTAHCTVDGASVKWE